MPTVDYIDGVMETIDSNTPEGAFWQMVVDKCQKDYPGVTLEQIVDIIFADD